MSSLLNNTTLKNQPIPEPGMGATLVWFSDRHAYTITTVSKTGKTFWMQRDKATRIDSNGMSETQEYKYERQTSEKEKQVKLTKDGWKTGGQRVVIGVRDEHYDYSF